MESQTFSVACMFTVLIFIFKHFVKDIPVAIHMYCNFLKLFIKEIAIKLACAHKTTEY